MPSYWKHDLVVERIRYFLLSTNLNIEFFLSSHSVILDLQE